MIPGRNSLPVLFVALGGIGLIFAFANNMDLLVQARDRIAGWLQVTPSTAQGLIAAAMVGLFLLLALTAVVALNRRMFYRDMTRPPRGFR